MNAARFFKCLSDETRLRCLMLLQSRGALCVCDLATALESSQPKISRHLAQLRACDVVSDHREGQWVFYRIHPELAEWQSEILNLTYRALVAELPFQADLSRLASIEHQEPASRCPI